ncbi:tRNA (adenine-N1)-methyltransferase [Archaeoglobus profundus]|uniref:tRNA methyltransferase complex GCD14 subunit n=1 Tax=Archaeoglobus profundus (strain DSM 5631 / JCM 9629 / NBRC 100127 / Av18) TaxID=572546 RepID=D2RFI6_ARCPA|nr:tRNA (adenine-N1)-methyltransferase [Archaeoglobus profundus]ADB58880.1 tRNA methyltransferase complex GCD14 subunit [Archaeoglobus profundus DSM 5631]
MKPPVILARGKHTFLVEKLEGTLHTHDGIINLEELKDKNFGDEVETHLGVKYKILPYRAVDFFKHFKRSATPIMPKDIGAIIAYTGLSPDSLILDAGTGTGMIAAYMAYFNKYGEVVTVEKRKEFAKVARENFKLAGLKNIHQIVGDVLFVAEGFKREFDLIILDMKDDVKFIPKAYEILNYGGFLVVYNPYIEDTRNVYYKMIKIGFRNVESFEILKIDYEHKRVGTRPLTRVWHTGFLVIGRKI